MKIICGTDFSSRAADAASVAGSLAVGFGTSVVLVHALDSGPFSLLDQNRRDYLLGRLRKKLSAEVVRLRGIGAKANDRLAEGSAPRVLAELADRQDAALIVVSSTGRTYPARWLGGSIAERTAQSASAPTLVIRDAAPLLAWTGGKKALNILVCYDFSASSDAAIRFVASLKPLGSCRVTVAYVSWPPQETWRTGIGGERLTSKNPPEVQWVLEQDLRERCAALLGKGKLTLRIVDNWGEPGAQLVNLAKDEDADLIVVGTNQRTGLNRFWLGSVSREVIHRAPMNVACVPAAIRSAETNDVIPRFKRVIVSTDLSKLGDKAIPFGCGVTQRGGEVLLIHVVPPTGIPIRDSGQQAERKARLKESLLERLRALVPKWTQARGVRTRVELVEHQHADVGICQAAERFRAELICMATQGRTGLKKRMLGSVTEAVMRRSKRPVLAIRE